MLSNGNLFHGLFFFQICKVLDISSQPERVEHILSLFNNEPEEFQLLEATKLLMYDAAVQLNKRLSRGEDVPVFSMLLFARDSCESPRDLLLNHLNKTGDTGGLEQVKWTNFPFSAIIPCRLALWKMRTNFPGIITTCMSGGNLQITKKSEVVISCRWHSKKGKSSKNKNTSLRS